MSDIMKIYIWGTGKVASEYLDTNEICNENLVGFIETKRTKDFFIGRKVYEPDEMKNNQYDFIFVLIYGYREQIKKIAEQYGIDLSKMVFLDTLSWNDGTSIDKNDKMRTVVKTIPCAENEEYIKEQFPKLYEKIYERRFYERSIISTYRNGKDDIDENMILFSEGFDTRVYSDDYFRYRTFEFVADEIIYNNVQGSCAEVGVYRGYFSKLINRKFPNKKMYLFDTFEGFDGNEIEKEIANGNAPRISRKAFVDTNEELVLKTMEYPDSCIIKRGYFPDSADGMDDTFAFVSIDVDLEESILECLRWFYPRMETGGYIFVHDYNNRMYFGVKKAFRRYEEEVGYAINMVPIADQGGTVIIQKH